MSALGIAVLCVGVYFAGFVLTAVIEYRFCEFEWQFNWSVRRRKTYSPFITPYPSFWPVAVVCLVLASPWLAAAGLVRLLTRGRVSP